MTKHITVIETFATAKERTDKAKQLRGWGYTVKVGKYKREGRGGQYWLRYDSIEL